MTTSPAPSSSVCCNCFEIHQVASYLSVLQLHGQNQLVTMVGQRFAVVSLGEECRAQIPMGTAFPCLVTWKKNREKRKEMKKSQHSIFTVVFIRHRWTAMWWTTSMPLTCHCALKRESARYKFSTVQQLPWQLVELISMLQRVRGESLIISAWQRGPTDRAKAKHKVFVLHLKTTAPYLQLLCPVMCQTVWGWEEWSQSVLLSVFIFFPICPPS